MINLKKSLLAGSAILAMGISTASLAAYGLPEAPAPVYNWYFGAFGGLTYTPSINERNSVLRFNNPNWDIGAHFGYRYDPVRFELEYLFQRSQVDQPLTLDGFNTNDVHGHINVNSAMANVLYDINVDSSVLPYIGFGIGYTNLDATTSATVTLADGTVVSGSVSVPSESRFGYQALAGVGFKVMENAMVNLGYRYFATTTGSDTSRIFNSRFQNHLFNVGFDYYFM